MSQFFTSSIVETSALSGGGLMRELNPASVRSTELSFIFFFNHILLSALINCCYCTEQPFRAVLSKLSCAHKPPGDPVRMQVLIG